MSEATCDSVPSTSKLSHAHSGSISSTRSSVRFGSVTTHSSAVTTSSCSNTHSLSKKRARHSLSALASLSNDISALIRSHSSSRRQHTPLHQSHPIYAGVCNMLQDDDRPTRKSKSENRLYRFIARSLTRSRSRSRSRNGRNTPPPVDPNEPVPELPPAQNGRQRLDSMGQSTPSKPTTRLQSRPLSSTTTATNTTLTPGTPRPKKRPPSAIPVRQNTETDLNHRSTTPKASTARRKLHTLFGIPLSSPKKSSFNSSRQSSRRQSLEAVHPHSGQEYDQEDDNPTPNALKSFSPNPYSRPDSPSPAAAKKLTHNPSLSTTTSSASGSSRLQRFFTGSKTPPPPSTDAVSAPMRSGSSHHRHNSNSNSTSNNSTTAPLSETHTSKPHTSRPRTSGAMGPPVTIPAPRTAYISRTPLRTERPGTAPQIAPSSSQGRSSSTRKKSLDLGRGVGKGDEAGGINGHTRIKMGLTQSQSHRSTKHGSFDFERPGWSVAASLMQRTASGGTTGSGTSGGTTGGLGRGQDIGIRESVMGPGLAGVGTLQRDVSMRRGKEREEMMDRARQDERRRRKAESAKQFAERELGILPEKGRASQPPPRRPTPEVDRSTPVSATKSASWGKKQGGIFGSSGKAKVASLGLSHGPFAFEPAVPSPTRSTGSTGTGTGNTGNDTSLSVSWAGEKGGDKLRVKGELERDMERWKAREKVKRSQSSHRGDRAPVPVPVTSASVGHRSGAKGRSLDLGIGLAWAPTTVREDALLPSSGFFGRTASGSSSLGGRSIGGRTVSGSGSATIEEESSVIGIQIANVFKNALDDTGYKAFKRYVDRFDAHDIPFDGPTGIVARVERLLMSAPSLSDEGKRQLLDSFVRVVLQHA